VLFAFLILILIPLCSSAGFSPGIWTNPSPAEYVTYDECTVWTVEEVLTYETTSTASVIRTESSYMPSVKSLNHIDFRFATATVYEVNNEYVSKFSFGTYVDYAAGASCSSNAYIHYDLSNGLYLYTDAFLDKCHTNYPKHFDQTWTNRRDMIVGTNEYGITNTIRRQATVSRSFHESITVSQVEACAIESVAAVWERKECPQDYRLPPFLVNPRPDYWVSEEWSEGISVDWIAALKYVKDWIKSSVVEKPYRVRYRDGVLGRSLDLPYSFYLRPPGITEVAIPWDLGGYEIRYKGYGSTSEKLGWLNTNKLTLAHHDAGVMSLHSGTGILTRAFSAPLLTLADLYEVVPEMPFLLVSRTRFRACFPGGLLSSKIVDVDKCGLLRLVFGLDTIQSIFTAPRYNKRVFIKIRTAKQSADEFYPLFGHELTRCRSAGSLRADSNK